MQLMLDGLWKKLKFRGYDTEKWHKFCPSIYAWANKKEGVCVEVGVDNYWYTGEVGYGIQGDDPLNIYVQGEIDKLKIGKLEISVEPEGYARVTRQALQDNIKEVIFACSGNDVCELRFQGKVN